MKTAKQLQDIMIRQRFNGGTAYYHYASDLIYKGYTTFDRLRMTYKTIPANFQGTEDEVKKLGLDFEELKAFVNKDGKEAERRITSRFEKYRIELNNFLNSGK